MKIAVTGKGGVGKTTFAATLARLYAEEGKNVLAADVDPDANLGLALGFSEEELDEIEKLIREVKKGLDEKNIPYKNIRTGIMIETPAAVMISEELGKRVDFLSLGTNDLTQYTLAMDRQNLLLKDKYNDHHPALVKMIRMVTEAGHKSGCEVYICGELAADSNLTEAFIQMGVDGLSVVPACVLPVRKAIRSSYADEANRPEEAVKEK